MHLILLLVLAFLFYFFVFRKIKKVSEEENIYMKKCITFSVVLYLIVLWFTSDDTASKVIYSSIIIFALYSFNRKSK